MAKLIRILAASLGGGLVLGAGIRLGERLVSQSAGDSGGEGAGKLSERLGQLEGRLSNLEAGGTGQSGTGIDLQGIESRINQQAAEVSAVRVRLDDGARHAETPGKTEERLRTELRAWMDQRVDERLRGVETKLRLESDEAQREMLNAVVERRTDEGHPANFEAGRRSGGSGGGNAGTARLHAADRAKHA